MKFGAHKKIISQYVKFYIAACLEADSQLLESLQFENRQLRGENEAQQSQLTRCQQEIEESRTMLIQLEQLAHQVQNSYSQHGSVRRYNISEFTYPVHA